jgi:hypothetical protein
MYKEFETKRFAIMKSDRVEIKDYRFGHNKTGKLDVWIDSSDKGKRFLRQITEGKDIGAISTGVYTKNCYILCEKTTGHFYFLDINDSGIWLFNHAFLGAENFEVSESVKIQEWLDNALNRRPNDAKTNDTKTNDAKKDYKLI